MRFRTAPMVGLLLVTLTLAGCTSAATASGDPAEDVAPTPSASLSPSPTPTPEPSPAPIDPADVTKWTVTAAGVGPIERGAGYPTVIEGLIGFETIEWCTGVVRLEHEAGTHIVLDLTEDGTRIDDVWVFSPTDDGSGSPETEAGIRRGASIGELMTSYPDLTTGGQIGADAWKYAAGSDAAGWIVFVAEDDVVSLIGSSDSLEVPREWCA